jgi:hypothetical protein
MQISSGLAKATLLVTPTIVWEFAEAGPKNAAATKSKVEMNWAHELRERGVALGILTFRMDRKKIARTVPAWAKLIRSGKANSEGMASSI